MIVSDDSAIPPGSIVSSPVSLVPSPHPYEESRTLSANKYGNSMLKNPHVDTLSALSNPIYSADDSSCNIYQTISSPRENDYEDLDENFNGSKKCAPYEVPVKAGAGVKGKASLRRKSAVVDAEDAMDTVIENQNADVDSAVESEQAKCTRTSHPQAIAKVRMSSYY